MKRPLECRQARLARAPRCPVFDIGHAPARLCIGPVTASHRWLARAPAAPAQSSAPTFMVARSESDPMMMPTRGPSPCCPPTCCSSLATRLVDASIVSAATARGGKGREG